MERFETNPSNLKAFVLAPYDFISKVEQGKDRIYEMLQKSTSIDFEELKKRAFQIKPLARVKGSKLAPLGTLPPDARSQHSSRLVYVNPVDIRKSYMYNFKENSIALNDDGDEIEAWGMEEVGRFICYHRYGGYWAFVCPSADEVLEQMPEEFLKKGVDAFEICFVSDDACTVFCPNINRHISIVVLYKRKGGLPDEIKNQHVIINDEIFYHP